MPSVALSRASRYARPLLLLLQLAACCGLSLHSLAHASTARAAPHIAALNADEPSRCRRSGGAAPPRMQAPSFDEFKKMMARDVDPSKLTAGEKVSKGVGSSWINPAYWNRQFVTASHISNNVRNGSRVLELGKDAKNLYYLNSPKSATLVVPPTNQKVQEGPIREAAAKMGLPFELYVGQALDTLPIRPSSFDAALCFDMLDGAPEDAAAGALQLLAGGLVPGGRLLFLERSTVGVPYLAKEYAGLNVKFDTEGEYDVGIATRRPAVGKGKASKKGGKKGKGKPPPMATKGGFGAPR